MKGLRNFLLTLAALIVYALISTGATDIRDINFLYLGFGLGFLIAPNAVKDIFQYLYEFKQKAEK